LFIKKLFCAKNQRLIIDFKALQKLICPFLASQRKFKDYQAARRIKTIYQFPKYFYSCMTRLILC